MHSDCTRVRVILADHETKTARTIPVVALTRF